MHTLAAVALNLGALQADAGAYGEALAATERAIRELGRMGATAELGTALFNAANLFVQVGQLGAARRALARARHEGARRGAAAIVEAFAAFVEGDLERREGQPARATELYRQAAAALRENGRAHEATARAGRGGDAGGGGDARRSAAALARGGVARRSGDATAPRRRRRRAGAGARAGAAGGRRRRSRRRHRRRRWRRSCAALADRAAAQGRLPAAWRAALVASRLWGKDGDRARVRRGTHVRDPNLRGGPHGDARGVSFRARE